MKKYRYLLVLLLVICGVFTTNNIVFAENVVVEENEFKGILKDDNTVILTKYPKSTTVEIPDTIEGYTVSEIGESCFYVDRELEKVIIPASVKIINNKSFYSCQNLKTLTFLDDGLEFIGDEAFSDCRITNLAFPSTVKSVGSRAFVRIATANITIPKSVTTWGTNIFYNGTVNKVVFEEGTKVVPEGMFSGCSTLTDVNLSSTIEEIQESAFSCGSNCVINEIILPASIKKIGKYAFYNITIKKFVNNSNMILDVNDSAFQGTKIQLFVSKDNNSSNSTISNDSKTEVVTNNTYLSSNNEVLGMGKTVQLKVINAKGETKWSTSNPKVATVSNGLVKAVAKGNAVITAVNNGVTMTCKIKVEGLALSSKKANVTVGYTTKLKLPGAKNVKWTSSNKKVATVSKSGVVKGIKKGKATITATYKKKKYKCKVQVVKNSYTFPDYPTNPALYPVNTAKMGFNQVYMNDKGDLIVKGKLMNNFSGNITSIAGLTITVYKDDVAVAKQYYSSYAVSVSAKSCKDVTFTIKKKNVKKKKCDLRNGNIRVEFDSAGVYHYE